MVPFGSPDCGDSYELSSGVTVLKVPATDPCATYPGVLITVTFR
jgi:hypothetical protein